MGDMVAGWFDALRSFIYKLSTTRQKLEREAILESITIGAAILIAAVMASAAVFKLVRLGAFRSELEDYDLLPTALIPLSAVLIPALELLSAVLILMPSMRVWGALLTVLLLAVFSGALVINLRRGRSSISCACFGRSSQALGWDLVIRNVLLIGAAILVGAAAPRENITSFAAAVVVAEATLLALMVIAAVRMFDRAGSLNR
jgi:hypothetical protein